jgi:hypothetical protein
MLFRSLTQAALAIEIELNAIHSATSNPRRRSSDLVREIPHNEFSREILRTARFTNVEEKYNATKALFPSAVCQAP